MSEDAPKVNLEGLGEHFGQQVVRHAQRHEQAGAQRKLEDLANKLRPITEAEHLGNATEPVHVQTLENGTVVSALLATGDTRPDPISLSDTAKDISGGNGLEGHSWAAAYLKDGPTYKILDELLNEDQRNQLMPGMHIMAKLETHGHEDSTEDMVLVGTLYDPESILVPEVPENPESTEPVYRIIGPDDSRFAPIMDMVTHVADNLQAQHQG